MSETKDASEISSREELIGVCQVCKTTYTSQTKLEQLRLPSWTDQFENEQFIIEIDPVMEQKIVNTNSMGTNNLIIGSTPRIISTEHSVPTDRSRKDQVNFLKKLHDNLPYRRPSNQTLPCPSQTRNYSTRHSRGGRCARSNKEVFDLEVVKTDDPNYSSHLVSSKSFSHQPLKGDNYYGLVGVELNPGPPKKVAKAKTKTVIKIVSAKKNNPSKPSSSGSTGRSLGSNIGGFIGDMAQKAIMGITGMGDYTVSNNTLYNGSVSSNGPPQFLSKGAAGTSRFLHREYVGDINGSVGFNITTYPINPLQANLFPWFNLMATNYEQFKIHGLVFEFKTMSATAVSSTNTALGTVIMATQYNVSDAPFANKLQMDQYQYAVSTVPSCSAIHPVECKPGLGVMDTLFTYTGSTGDIRFSTFGNFSIATVGMQAASNIGELWVSYDIELIKPRLFGSGVANNPSFVGGASNANVIPFSPSDFLSGGSWLTSPSSTIPITFGTAATFNANTLVFPGSVIGNYMLTIYMTLNSSGGSGTTVWNNGLNTNLNITGTLSSTVSLKNQLGGTGGSVSTTVGPVIGTNNTATGANLSISWNAILGFAGSVSNQTVALLPGNYTTVPTNPINITKIGIYLTPFEL